MKSKSIERILNALLVLYLVSGCSAITPVNTGLSSGGGNTPVTEIPVTPTEKIQTLTVTPTQTQEPVCTEVQGHIEQVRLPTTLQPNPFVVSIYTPPCFTQTPEELYPVLYLLHGQTQDDTYWLSLGIADIVDKAINAGQRPFIIVMPYEERNFDPIDETPFPTIFMDELIPWVEANYPTCNTRECRAIGGISRGAGWAVRLSLYNFYEFGSVGAHSLGLFTGDWRKVYKLRQTYSADQFPRYYIDRGESDFLAEYIDLFRDTLKDNGIAYEYHVSPGDHGPKYWREHVQEYIDWYMQAWK